MKKSAPRAETTRDLSDLSGIINIMKALIGMGILSLPYATASVGWLPSVIGMFIVGWLTLCGIFMAIMSKDRMTSSQIENDAEKAPLASESSENRRKSHSSERAGQHGGMVCSFDKLVGDAMGYPCQIVCALSILLGQYTCGIAYVEVIAESLGTYWRYSFLSTYLPIGIVLMVFCCAESLKKITFLSAAALLTYFFILVALVDAVTVKGGDGSLGEAPPIAPHSDYGTFLGIVAFAYGGLPIATLVYDDLKNPDNIYKVASTAYFGSWISYVAFAVLGYIAYGSNVSDVIYFSFVPGSVWREASLVCIVVILALTFVLQMMPVFSWAEALCYRPTSPFPFCRMHYTVIRFFIVAPTVLIAYILPSVTALVGTVGAITQVLSGMLFPAVLFAKVSRREDFPMRVMSLLLFALGTFAIVRTLVSAASGDDE